MGRKPVAARLLERMAHDDRVTVVGVLTDSQFESSPTTDLAQRLGLPLYEFEEALAAAEDGTLEFDLGLSVLYWRKLRGALLDRPRLGFINFHPAPLPDYKGVGGYNCAILDDLAEWGVSAHYVDEEIDTGPIIAVDRFPMDLEEETARSLEAKSMEALERQALRLWSDLAADPRLLPTSENCGGRYVTRKELEAMKEIDFDTDDVRRKIRAFWFPPYDGAHINHEGAHLTLVDRSILTDLADPDSNTLFATRRASA
nr:formyltransferase family protein [Tsuneonella aeria]